jgi:DAK2 domain fusion protein YloV
MLHDRDSREGALIWCGGAELRLFFAGGLAALERCATAVDKLNVFPVPDGDTGTNLSRTVADALQTVTASASGESTDDVGVVAGQLADAALLHARGNSGTIFAQLCAGIAQSLAGQARTDAKGWANAWEVAAWTARRSVNAPVAGTILTVASDAAATARTASATVSDLIAVWRAMADAAEATVARTPGMLAVLADANVVDAGALGLALFLRGGVARFTGEPLPDPATLMQPSEATRRVIEQASFPRYCTQFLLHSRGANDRQLASRLATFGDSVDIVRSGSSEPAPIMRIHLHTDDPDAVVAYASTVGAVSGLKVEDMQRQRAMLLSGAEEPQAIVMMAVASGDGMRKLFESLYGVVGVVQRLEDIDAAIDEQRARTSEASARQILLLANDEHLLTSADASINVRDRGVVFVPTRNAPEGVAAALAFDPSLSAEENARVMTEAARRVQTICVTSAGDLFEAAQAALLQLTGGATDVAGLITMYYGAGVSRSQLDELIAFVEHRYPALETEVIAGGQPECPLWIALETDAGSNRH